MHLHRIEAYFIYYIDINKIIIYRERRRDRKIEVWVQICIDYYLVDNRQPNTNI